PEDVTLVRVESAEQMFAACEKALPVDIAICTAAVADWQPIQVLDQKLKKEKGKTPPDVKLKETPDILLHLGYHKFHRPSLVVGFAAETGNVIENAKIKRVKKGCDWIIANDVSGGQVFGASENQVHLVTDSGSEAWPAMRKQEVALRLVDRIASYFTQTEKAKKAV
ncbi:MAG: bifunctional phosphopantothenoylcysteine decarboxylase/phosphopantothenate synthase, partial [Alphaproteobacteria bacterium]|nr:bifunctional phosphopantothenoylcysteine decarboxylase/phosphopantothenate synthase [Alphaproteobacteria bacterium]